MTRDEFLNRLADKSPDTEWPPAWVGLWYAGRNDWDAAHEAVQAHEADRDCCWVHAYLHRWEGDQANAAYWYRRAGRAVSRADRNEEWRQIVEAICEGV